MWRVNDVGGMAQLVLTPVLADMWISHTTIFAIHVVPPCPAPRRWPTASTPHVVPCNPRLPRTDLKGHMNDVGGDGCGGMASSYVQPPLSPSPPTRKSGGVFGALARLVLPWGNGSFPGGSIGGRVLCGPAWKGPTPPQRARWDAPAPATPSSSDDGPPLTPPSSSTVVPRVFKRVRYMPRRCFPSPTHPHTHRGEACRGHPGGVARQWRHPAGSNGALITQGVGWDTGGVENHLGRGRL